MNRKLILTVLFSALSTLLMSADVHAKKFKAKYQHVLKSDGVNTGLDSHALILNVLGKKSIESPTKWLGLILYFYHIEIMTVIVIKEKLIVSATK